MPRKPYRRPVFQLVCPVASQEDQLDDDEFMDVLSADMALGIAAQDHCKTREELVTYAQQVDLVPYLRFFVERRGWLDDDWTRCLEQLEAEFQRQVN